MNEVIVNIYVFESIIVRGTRSKVHDKFVVVKEHNCVN